MHPRKDGLRPGGHRRAGSPVLHHQVRRRRARSRSIAVVEPISTLLPPLSPSRFIPCRAGLRKRAAAIRRLPGHVLLRRRSGRPPLPALAATWAMPRAHHAGAQNAQPADRLVSDFEPVRALFLFLVDEKRPDHRRGRGGGFIGMGREPARLDPEARCRGRQRARGEPPTKRPGRRVDAHRRTMTMAESADEGHEAPPDDRAAPPRRSGSPWRPRA